MGNILQYPNVVTVLPRLKGPPDYMHLPHARKMHVVFTRARVLFQQYMQLLVRVGGGGGGKGYGAFLLSRQNLTSGINAKPDLQYLHQYCIREVRFPHKQDIDIIHSYYISYISI